MVQQFSFVVEAWIAQVGVMETAVSGKPQATYQANEGNIL
jgi:hypothetical protein